MGFWLFKSDWGLGQKWEFAEMGFLAIRMASNRSTAKNGIPDSNFTFETKEKTQQFTNENYILFLLSKNRECEVFSISQNGILVRWKKIAEASRRNGNSQKWDFWEEKLLESCQNGIPFYREESVAKGGWTT